MLKRFALPLILIAVLVSLASWLWFSPFWKSIRWMGAVMQIVHEEYVDPEAVNYEALAEAAARGMLESLDPFSTYLNEDAFSEFKISSGDAYSGIGVEISAVGDYAVVSHVYTAGPSDGAGLRIGDLIRAVNGENQKGKTINEVSREVRGPAGTEVELTVERPGAEEWIEVQVRRGEVQMESIRHSRLFSNGIGYLHISQFVENTKADFVKVVENWPSEPHSDRPFTGLIVDLRSNPGGYLRSALEMTGLFFPEGTLILYREGRDWKDREDYFAPDGPDFPEVPIVFLVDRNTASAAEILAGCLQDFDRAVIVGEKTFGKGSIQQVYQLRNGGGLRQTVAKYFFPSGRTINKTGVEPDIEIEGSHAGYLPILLSRRFQEIPEEQFESLFGFERMETDPALEAAVAYISNALEE